MIILQQIITQKKAKTNLEIGVDDGSTFLKIKAPQKIAVFFFVHYWTIGYPASSMKEVQSLI